MSQKVIFDTNFLTYFSDSNGSYAFEPEDENDLLDERFDYLLERLSAADAEIIIPAPVLAEVLSAKHKNQGTIIDLINEADNMNIIAFDARQSIEFGYLFRNTNRDSDHSRNAFKFDLLILACAKVHGVSVIYTADKQLRRKAERMEIQAYSFQDLERIPSNSPKTSEDRDLFSIECQR